MIAVKYLSETGFRMSEGTVALYIQFERLEALEVAMDKALKAKSWLTCKKSFER